MAKKNISKKEIERKVKELLSLVKEYAKTQDEVDVDIFTDELTEEITESLMEIKYEF